MTCAGAGLLGLPAAPGVAVGTLGDVGIEYKPFTAI